MWLQLYAQSQQGLAVLLACRLLRPYLYKHPGQHSKIMFATVTAASIWLCPPDWYVSLSPPS